MESVTLHAGANDSHADGRATGHLPLADLVVLDLTQQLPGPYATMLLRSMGATIIKVEPPSGDAARTIDPEMFDTLNRDKLLLQLDLKTVQDQAMLRSIAARSQVLVEGFRPGVMSRLGAAYDVLRTGNESLIYCSISGFGSTGPMSRLPAHDVNLLAMAGGIPGTVNQSTIGIPFVDLATGTTAALAIVASLRADAPRRGTHLELSMLDSAVVWSAIKASAMTTRPEPTYGTFDTGDSSRVAVAVLEDHHFQLLCKALSWDDWLLDQRFATYQSRQVAHEQIRSRLTDTLRSRPGAEWLDVAAHYHLPITPVLSAATAIDHSQIRARDLYAGGRVQTPLPAGIRAHGVRDPGPPDSDREQILAWLEDPSAALPVSRPLHPDAMSDL